MNIVIADDESMVRSFIANMLRDTNVLYSIWEAEDGEEVIHFLNQHTVNLVISDIRMPCMDGLQLAEYMREHFPEIPLILLTGFDDFQYAVHALRNGVAEYLLKPVSQETLLATVAAQEQKQAELKNEWQLDQLRERNTASYRLRDLLYEVSIPYYDELIFPADNHLLLCSFMPNPGHGWQTRTLLLSIKNCFEEASDSPGLIYAIAEEKHVVVVLFFDPSLEAKLCVQWTERTAKTIEQLLKAELKLSVGGTCEALSGLKNLYDTSLSGLGLNSGSELPVEKSPANAVHRLVRFALHRISTDYDKELTLASLADTLQTNPNYLSNLFKTEMGQTFTQYLIAFRMQHAQKLLVETNLYIYEVCSRVGYTDQAYFNRIFKNVVGMTPYEYRERYTLLE